ncbi:MAG: hypothetical protein JW810_12115 [Sedimentisphaerales bacterium]|nr:hypothetical protein [Sedimentisphaerales bacterium]
MEFFRRTIQQIKLQLGALTASQRLVVILLLVIMGGAIVWMIRYSGQREMVPLLDQPFAENTRQRIVTTLEGWDQSYQLKGDRILVPKTDQKKLLARLAYAGMLPEDTSIGWSILLEDSDIWTPEYVRQTKKLIIKQTELARIIAQFPGVEKAQVIINEAGKRRLSNVQPTASASVMLQLAPTEQPTRRLALSVAEFVSAANSRMKRSDVKVVANGELIPIPAEGEEMSADYWRLKASAEREYRQKILGILPVANALVQVDVTLLNTETKTETTKYANEGDGTTVVTVDSTNREETTTESQSAQEPGVIANAAGPMMNNSAGGQNQSSEETSRTNQVGMGSTKTVAVTGKGGASEITATVRMPISYFEEMAKKESGQDQPPDTAAVKLVVDRDLPQIQKSVLSTIGLVDSPENEERVVINTYWEGGGIADNSAAPGGFDVAAANAGGSMTNIVRSYGKHIAVSALAILSLFMVLMMVRRAAGPVEIAEDEAALMLKQGKKPLDALGLEDSNLADGAEGGLLAGIEMDENSVRSQQMLEQIREMVKESPDTAANLVGKWISQRE